jgi:hypothetical protein
MAVCFKKSTEAQSPAVRTIAVRRKNRPPRDCGEYKNIGIQITNGIKIIRKIRKSSIGSAICFLYCFITEAQRHGGKQNCHPEPALAGEGSMLFRNA